MKNQVTVSGLPAMMVTRIKTLQGLAGLGDDDYRALLGGYGVASCKDLSIVDARRVITFLQEIVDRIPQKRPVPKRYADIGDRLVEMASTRQLRMLEGMWSQVTRQSSSARARSAYSAWLLKRFGIGSAEWIKAVDVGKIKRALEAMGAVKLG